MKTPFRHAGRIFVVLCAGVARYADAQIPEPSASPVPVAVITPADGASVQRGIMAAYHAGQKTVTIPPGVYEIPAQEKGSIHLKFEDLHDFEIDARGAVFVTADQRKGSVLFRRCRHVAFRGATVRNGTPPLTQGVIEAVAPDRSSCDVRVDAGYPATLDDPAYFEAALTFYLFDPKTRLLKDGSKDNNCTRTERLGPDRFRLHAKTHFWPDVAPGNLFATRGKGGMGIMNQDCEEMTFEDVTMEFAGTFGFFEIWGEGGNVYRRIRVQPGPKPPGATGEPLLSEVADGFHSAAMRHGPTIENSFLTRMPDDGIAIHGYFVGVRQVEGTRVVISQGHPNPYFKPGDHFGAVSKTGIPIGEAVVTAEKGLPDNFLPPMASQFRVISESHSFAELTLDHELPVTPGDFGETSDRLGSGFILRGNTIKDHRARGLLLKAHDGLVENNTVEGSSIAGIALLPQLWWGEAGFCRNVVVRGNTVRHVGYASVTPESSQAGAITVLGELDTPEARGNRNIAIEGNTIEDVDGVNLELDGVEGCVVRHNRFVHAQREATTRGAAKVDPGALVFINRARDVRLEDNTVEGLGAANKTLIKLTPNASEITGSNTGVRVLP